MLSIVFYFVNKRTEMITIETKFRLNLSSGSHTYTLYKRTNGFGESNKHFSLEAVVISWNKDHLSTHWRLTETETEQHPRWDTRQSKYQHLEAKACQRNGLAKCFLSREGTLRNWYRYFCVIGTVAVTTTGWHCLDYTCGY